MQQETEYYATHYGQQPNLVGFTVGGFTDWLDSPRASVLAWSTKTKKYEIGQYTSLMEKYWRQWLLNQFSDIDRINQEYQTKFARIEEVPLPKNETDKQFGLPYRAYFDFVSAINEWWQNQYTYTQTIWQKSSKVPFILQLNGTLIEKIIAGRSSYAAFNLPTWFSNVDAVGLSLYTDSKLPDTGLSSLFALTNLTQWSRDLGKPIFVLESGLAQPKAGFDLYQLRAISELAMPLNPRAYIYEYLRYPKSDKAIPPGMLYTADWKLNQPMSSSIQRVYHQASQRVEQNNGKPLAPYFYAITAPKSIRDDMLAAKFYSLLYATATFVPLRMVDIHDIEFIPAKQIVLITPSWKSELPEVYQTKILQLAKRRSWLLICDEHTYPEIQQQLGKEVAGATIDLAGYLKEIESGSATTGFGKAIVDFYITQQKTVPNGLTAEPGVLGIPYANGIHVFCNQSVEMIPIDSVPWNLTEQDEFHVMIYRQDSQSTFVRLTIPIFPRGTVKTIRWTVTEIIGGKKMPVPAKTIKNKIEFTAKNGVDYLITSHSHKT